MLCRHRWIQEKTYIIVRVHLAYVQERSLSLLYAHAEDIFELCENIKCTITPTIVVWMHSYWMFHPYSTWPPGTIITLNMDGLIYTCFFFISCVCSRFFLMATIVPADDKMIINWENNFSSALSLSSISL